MEGSYVDTDASPAWTTPHLSKGAPGTPAGGAVGRSSSGFARLPGGIELPDNLAQGAAGRRPGAFGLPDVQATSAPAGHARTKRHGGGTIHRRWLWPRIGPGIAGGSVYQAQPLNGLIEPAR